MKTVEAQQSELTQTPGNIKVETTTMLIKPWGPPGRRITPVYDMSMIVNGWQARDPTYFNGWRDRVCQTLFCFKAVQLLKCH